MKLLHVVFVRQLFLATWLLAFAHRALFAEPEMGQSPVVATFSDGSQAELVGVAPHPAAIDDWWHPNGTARESPYATMRSRANGPFTREFCWRWLRLGERTVAQSFSVIEPRANGYAGGSPRDDQGKSIPGLSAAGMSFNVDDDLATASVSFTAEVGRWRNVKSIEGTSSVAGGERLGDGRSLAYIVGRPIQNGEDVSVVVSLNLTRIPLRVVAIDREGRTIEGTSRRMSAGDITQIAATFAKTEVGSIAGFRIEERDLEQVTIRNVSMQPDQRTDVHIDDILTRLGESPSPEKRGQDGRSFHSIRLANISPDLAKDAINSLGEAKSDETGIGFRAEIDDLRKRILLRCNDQEMKAIRGFLTQLGEPAPQDSSKAEE